MPVVSNLNLLKDVGVSPGDTMTKMTLYDIILGCAKSQSNFRPHKVTFNTAIGVFVAFVFVGLGRVVGTIGRTFRKYMV